jgi:hypothetical protein
MKVFSTRGIAVLFLSLGTIAPAFAQHEQEGAKPENNPQQQHAQQPQQQHAQQSQQQAMQQNKNNRSSNNR